MSPTALETIGPANPDQPVPIGPALAAATRELTGAGVESARVDAELLAAYVLNVPRSRLVLAGGFDPAGWDRYRAVVRERASRVPLQCIVGSAAFRRLDLAVGPGVFIPRPETELLVSWGLSEPARVVVDLCSGTGAIALAVATESPGTEVYAVERDPRALEWLRRNVSGSPVRVIAADVTEPGVLADRYGRVDLVLCNPPYVPDGTPVPPEVAEHDPGAAVFGGPDGLAVIRPVIGLAARLLRPGGRLGIEHDDSQGGAVPELLRAAGAYTDIEDHRDLAGRPRFATAGRLADSLS